MLIKKSVLCTWHAEGIACFSAEGTTNHMLCNLHFQIMNKKQPKLPIYQQKLGTHVLAVLCNYLPIQILTEMPQAQNTSSILHSLTVQCSNRISQFKNAYSPPALTVLGGRADPAGDR